MMPGQEKLAICQEEASSYHKLRAARLGSRNKTVPATTVPNATNAKLREIGRIVVPGEADGSLFVDRQIRQFFL
jgi:hypothetical protein